MPLLSFETFIASWDDTVSGSRIMYTDKSQSGHQSVFENLKATHRPISISGSSNFLGIPNYSSVWERNDGRYWETRHGIPATEFQAVFDDAKKRGIRPVFIDGFAKNVNAAFNSVWEKDNNHRWSAEFGISQNDYQSKFDQHCREGLRLLSVSPYTEGNQLKYATVWDSSPCNGWAASHGMSLAQFNNETDANNARGYVLNWAKSARWKGTETFAAIWEKKSGIRIETRQAMDRTTLGEYQAEFKTMGLNLRMLSHINLGQEKDTLLRFPGQPQNDTLWCWAACASSIADYYGINKSQCELVSWDFGILGNNPALNCCLDGVDCNNGGDLARILDRMNLKKSTKSGVLSYEEIRTELLANRPVGIYVVWNSGGHHIMVITGCEISQMIRIADPNRADPYWMPYSAMINRSSFTWDHSIFTKKPV